MKILGYLCAAGMITYAIPCYGDEIECDSKIGVTEFSSKHSLNHTIQIIRKKFNERNLNWGDVICYWKSDDRIFLMMRSKMVEGSPRMTNDQWLHVDLVNLQASGVLKLIAYSKVIEADPGSFRIYPAPDEASK